MPIYHIPIESADGKKGYERRDLPDHTTAGMLLNEYGRLGLKVTGDPLMVGPSPTPTQATPPQPGEAPVGQTRTLFKKYSGYGDPENTAVGNTLRVLGIPGAAVGTGIERLTGSPAAGVAGQFATDIALPVGAGVRMFGRGVNRFTQGPVVKVGKELLEEARNVRRGFGTVGQEAAAAKKAAGATESIPTEIRTVRPVGRRGVAEPELTDTAGKVDTSLATPTTVASVRLPVIKPGWTDPQNFPWDPNRLALLDKLLIQAERAATPAKRIERLERLDELLGVGLPSLQRALQLRERLTAHLPAGIIERGARTLGRTARTALAIEGGRAVYRGVRRLTRPPTGHEE